MGSFGAEDRKDGKAAVQRAFQLDKHRATTSSEAITLHHLAPGGGGRDAKPVLPIMGVLDEGSLFSGLSADNGVHNFMMPGTFHAADRIDDEGIAALFWQMQKQIPGCAQRGRTEVFEDPVEGADVATLDLFVPTVAPATAPAAAQPRFTFMYMDPVVGADVAAHVGEF